MNLIEAWANLMRERWRAGLGPNLVVEVPHSEMLRMWRDIEQRISCAVHSSITGIRGPVRLQLPGGYIEFRDAPAQPARRAPPDPPEADHEG